MDAFGPYVEYLKALVLGAGDTSNSELPAQIEAALNGQPAQQLRRLAKLEDLRSAGAFFTGSKLATYALSLTLDTVDNRSVILDPACGAGDLLIACAQQLPRGTSLRETLDLWGVKLLGRDLFPQFISAARLRLVLSALTTSPSIRAELVEAENELPLLQQGSGLDDIESIEAATHIVMNPPFSYIDAPRNCSWSSGKINSAALFVEKCVLHARQGTHITAILPDVLRSGSRYQKWRELIEARCSINRLEVYGRFDHLADVDVFILDLKVNESTVESPPRPSWYMASNTEHCRLKDLFYVRIGPVVDYREPEAGPLRPFICSRDVPPWGILKSPPKIRRFMGTTIKPPFVAIRRISRPGDQHRAVGTIITGTKQFAVENHLIALIPKDGSLESCRRALEVLRKKETTEWLDHRICCRHLTVSALGDLPWLV
jgi:hypothetical protein